MPVTVDAILAAGHDLAQQYAAAVATLNRHWEGEDGMCIGCGDACPCAAEWTTQRKIVAIEVRWRLEGQRLAELRQTTTADAADQEETNRGHR